MPTSSAKRSTTFSSSSPSAKKLRQTTLSFVPIARAPQRNVSASASSYFASPKPKPPSLGREGLEASSTPSITSLAPGEPDSQLEEDDDGEFTQELGSQLSELDFDSQASASTSAEMEGRQFTYPVPVWSRPIRKLDMAREARKPYGAQHKFHESRVAAETLLAIPQILAATAATTEGKLYVDEPQKSLFILRRQYSPNLPPCRVSVTPEDTYAAAIRLLSKSASPVCVLNMASAHSQGGGWLEGCTAQEEQLCYRSTLIRTLDPSYYPWPNLAAVFSPSVAIFRTSAPDYQFYASLSPERDPEIVSVVSAAAIRCNKLKDKWDMPWQRRVMRQKMKLILRVCGRNLQRRLVLGAFGCGAFLNPNTEVAELWKEILEEEQFKGWWKEIVFAVFVPPGNNPEMDSNFVVFRDVLDGLKV